MFILFKDEINLPLAIQDYLPVTLFAVGLFFIAKMISNRNKEAGNLAFFGGVLVTLGGLFKASWKLIQAAGGSDIPFLNNSLFTLMSAGFICLAWAFWKSRQRTTDPIKLWVVPIVLIALFWLVAGYIGFFTESRAWFFILLGATTLANLALLFQLIHQSFRQKLWLAVGLFLINLIVIFLLARSSDQTVTLQWVKQLINTVSQFSFAVASWKLLQNQVSLD
ncbi:MAG: hypothetical protein HC846_05625 [Blastocatellia bacterium]|nr:hypothetical protein [Blastocatellia bacterium]